MATPPTVPPYPLRATVSPTAVRALYALQLEMDTLLGVRVAAQCRLWAEDRHRLRRAAAAAHAPAAGGDSAGTGPGATAPSSSSSASSAAAAAGGVGAHAVTLYVAVVDVSRLRASAGGVADVGGLMASKRVDAYVQMKVRVGQSHNDTTGGPAGGCGLLLRGF